jgi:hypothetical protein
MRAWTITLFMLAVSIGCVAQAPVFSSNATSFDFGGVAVGGVACCPAGPQREIIITNTGTALLSVSDIQMTGDFSLALFSPRSFQLNAGDTRSITIQFDATAAGPRSGSVAFIDNAPGNPQTFALTGVGLTNDFSLSVEETPASATVNAGQGAGFVLDLASGAQFPTSTITLSCTGLPPGSNFSVLAQGLGTQFGLGPQILLSFSVGVSTRATAVAESGPKLPLWYGFAFIPLVGLISLKQRKHALPGIVVLIMSVALISCGGSTSFPDQATPPGAYHLVFTATTGTTTHTAPATLIVH